MINRFVTLSRVSKFSKNPNIMSNNHLFEGRMLFSVHYFELVNRTKIPGHNNRTGKSEKKEF